MNPENYALLASAMAGRVIGVSRSEIGAGYTNGRVIYLPDSDDKQRQLVTLVVQSALISAGSLDIRVIARLMGRRQVALRYLTLEAIRAVKSIGCAPCAVQDFVLGLSGQSVSASPNESLLRAMSDILIPAAPEIFGVLRPSKIMFGGGMAQALSALKPLPENVAQGEIQEIQVADDDEDVEESKILKLMSSPVFGDNPLARILRDAFLNARRSADPDGNSKGGAELPVGSRSAVDSVGEHARLAERPAGLAAFQHFVQPTRSTYPEWHWEREEFLPKRCSVIELDPSISPEDKPIHAASDHLLQRNLARLGLGLETHKRRAEGEALDLHAMVDLALSRAAGEQGDERVYETRLRTSHELGVIVLLDASGSTAEQREGAAAVWDAQRRLALNLISGLEQVGDRVAAYGFRSFGPHDVRFLRLKDFDGRFDGGARARLAALQPSGFTRLGAAVRHAVHLATTKAGTSRLLLVLISDGLPYEDGYEGRYAQEDTRHALAEAVDSGVGCVCISVGASTDDAALKELWGDVSYLRISEPSSLGLRVEPLFRSALRAALEGTHGKGTGSGKSFFKRAA